MQDPSGRKAAPPAAASKARTWRRHAAKPLWGSPPQTRVVFVSARAGGLRGPQALQARPSAASPPLAERTKAYYSYKVSENGRPAHGLLWACLAGPL